MASIRKRGKDHWQAQVRRNGHPPQIKTFQSRPDAERWAKVVESKILLGSYKPDITLTSDTLGQCLNRYSREVTPLKKGSVQELSILQRLEKLPLAKRAMGSIKGSDIALYRDDRLKVVGPATVARELAVLSHVFTKAAKEWGMETLENPVLWVQKPRLPKGRTRRLSKAEENKLITASDSPFLPSLIKLVLETGMRRSELCGLNWTDINLAQSTLVLNDTKNGESRVIPLSKRARAVLEPIKPKEGKVFNLRPDSVTQAFERACERAKIENLRFHDLRHEATSRFIEKGLSVMDAALITGHKDLRMLLRYTHLRPEAILAKLD